MEFSSAHSMRWLSLSTVSRLNWNLECWFLWMEEKQRTRRKTHGAGMRTNKKHNTHLTPGPGILGHSGERQTLSLLCHSPPHPPAPLVIEKRHWSVWMLCQFCLERCDVLDIDIVTQSSFMQTKRVHSCRNREWKTFQLNQLMMVGASLGDLCIRRSQKYNVLKLSSI